MSEHDAAQDIPTPDYGRLIIGLSALVFTITLAAVAFLIAMGKDPGPVADIAGPVIGVLFLGGFMQSLTSGQNRQLSKIDRQTNGVLDARIRTQGKAAMLEALTEVGVIQGAVIEPATPGPPVADLGAAGATLPEGFVDAALAKGAPTE